MRLHALVHDTELRAKPLNVVFGVRLNALDIHSVLVQRMQDALFGRVSRLPLRTVGPRAIGGGRYWHLRNVAIIADGPDQPRKEVARDVGDGIERGRLELFEAGMIEDLSDGALQRGATNARRCNRTVVGHDRGFDILLDERFGVVLLELILVDLRGEPVRRQDHDGGELVVFVRSDRKNNSPVSVAASA